MLKRNSDGEFVVVCDSCDQQEFDTGTTYFDAAVERSKHDGWKAVATSAGWGTFVPNVLLTSAKSK